MDAKKAIVFSRYPLVSEWLSALLSGMGWQVTMGVEDKNTEVLRIVDISDGQDLVILEAQLETGAPVVVFSRLPETKLLGIIFDYEIKGVIHFSTQMNAVEETLEAAANGEEYFDETILTFMLSGKYREIHDRVRSLSKRELEIIDGILEDLTNDEIAERFDLSVRTVNAHKRNILQKMEERSLVGVVKTILTYSIRFR
jgi:DNA-binding NarL/FixJ family response regulator